MMATIKLFCQKISIISLILCISHAAGRGEEKRWSRQISNSGFLNDWIPVQPMVQSRQTNGRVLNFGPHFQQAQNGIDAPVFMNHQQSSAISSPSTNLGEPFQRIFLQQMHPPNLQMLPQNQQQQLHASNSAPFRLHHDIQLNQGPQHFLLQHNPQQQQQPDVPHQNFRFPHFNAPAKPEFIRNDESSLHQTIPQHEQLIRHEAPQQMKHNGIDHHSSQSFEMQQVPPQEEVQLLYVPLDTLYHQQQDKLQNARYNVLQPPLNPLQINNFYTHHQKFPATTAAPATIPIKITTSAAKLRTTTSKPVHRFSFGSTVTESPKPKSHQPPLAMFMRNTMSFSNEPTVNDVLSNLIFSKQIDVIDSVHSQTPDIFIGPYGLDTPDGYTKFELPYLSSLELNQSERQIRMLPFFVAPLSYRVPKGFAKIPLPSPHVGSVVVNSPNSVDLRDYSEKDFFFSDSKFIVPSTARTTATTSTTTTTKQPPLQYFSYSSPASVPERQRQTTSRFRFGSDFSKSTYQNDPETIPTTPSSLTSFSVYKSTAPYNSQPEQNVPRIPITTDESEDQTYHFGNIYHSVDNYATASPTPKQETISDYKPKNEEPAKISSTNQQPIKNSFSKYFTQSSTGSYFNTIEPVVTTKQPKRPEITRYEVTNYDDRYNSFSPTQIPSTSTSASTSPPIREESAYRNGDVEKMKSYFREQEAFKVHQPIAISTPAAYYESSTAGTLATEKGFSEFSTMTYFAKEPKQNQNQNVGTTPRTTVTYYTASTSLDDADNTNANINNINNHYNQPAKGTAGHSVHQFRFVDSVQRDENRIHSTPKPERERPSQQTDSLHFDEIFNSSPRFEPTRASYRERQTISPYDENTASYNIPSELSPIGANLPGLVNSLMEKDETTPLFVPTTAPTVAVTTRRSTVSRGRRPQTTQRSSTTDENVAAEITTRRPLRSRRPINYANRVTTARTNTIRNSNRVRFNSSADERNNNNGRQRTKARAGTRPTKNDKEEENIDYQRDVLKQNYPVASNHFEKNITKSSDFDLGNKVFYSRETTITPPFEQTKSDKDIGPLNSVKDPNYYEGRDDAVANSINRITSKPNQDVDSPIFVSTTTLTSIQNEENQEEITEVLRTRKPSFIRRVSSSTAKPTTLMLSVDYDASRNKERNPPRQKTWQETNTSPTRTVKLRTRGKRPNSIQQTTTVGPTDDNTDQPLYKERKQNSDSRSIPEKKRNQFRFSLNAEESQWSTKYNSNSFQPINSNEKPKVENDSPEVEIVTASPMLDSDKEMYSFNVQANFFDFNKNKEKESASTTQPAMNSAESDTADSVLSKLNGNANAVTESSTVSFVNTESKSKSKSESYNETNLKSEKKGKRRGIWKRVRVRPVDSFEAAESQNLGKQWFNTLYDENKNNANVMQKYGDRSKHKYTDFETDILPSYDEMYDQVQTSTTPNDSDSTTLDIEAIEATTEPILKDERESEATSTSFYRNDDDDETATTTFTPFSAIENQSNDTKRYLDNFESFKEEKAQVTEIMKETRDNTEKVTEPSSIMDEVKQKLTELFSFEDDDVVVSTTERVFKINRNFGKRPKSALPLYTSIDRDSRDPLINDIANDDKDSEIGIIKSSPASMKLEPVPVYKTILKPITEPSSFHKELMDSVIYATSTSTEISHETEICYRGRCVKTQKKP